MSAWRKPSGDVQLSKQPIDGQYLRLPCGNCIGCRTQRAQAWALRCQLELADHKTAVFATLTYDDEHKPLTLNKQHVAAYIKKIRKQFPNKLRFFASGEYGDHTHRPHYHAIIYGASQLQAPRLEEAWTKGHVRVDQATPAAIAYVAGYCNKKIGYKRTSHERVDPITGEVYQWQPPFLQMSRNPGIGAAARSFTNSWRLYAVKDGHKLAVPRYLKDAYKKLATPEDLELLQKEIDALNVIALSQAQLRQAEIVAEAKQKQQGEKRPL